MPNQEGSSWNQASKLRKVFIVLLITFLGIVALIAILRIVEIVYWMVKGWTY